MRSPASTQDTSVRYFTNNMATAPKNSGEIGEWLAVIRAFLVTGGTALDVTSMTVASGIATVNFASTPDAFGDSCVVRIAGVAAPNAELNGDHRITERAATFIKFPVTTGDTTATGTITVQLAPLDYIELFSGTNEAAFKSSDPASYGGVVKFDNTMANGVQISVYGAMTDISTGTDRMPPEGVDSFWTTTYFPMADTPYYLIGDSRAFYYGSNTYYPYGGRGFTHGGVGDLISYRAGFAWDTFLMAQSAITPATTEGNPFLTADHSRAYLMREWTAIGTAVPMRTRALSGAWNSISGDDVTFGAYPSKVDGSLRLSPMTACGNNVDGIRGELPGINYIPMSGLTQNGFQSLSVIEGNGTEAGRKMLVVPTSGPTSGLSTAGIGLFDLTNPWR